MDQDIDEALARRLAAALTDLSAAMQETFNATAPALKIVAMAMRDAYHAAGAPYGDRDSDVGLWRWLRECAEAARHRRIAEEIEARHRDLADMRALGQQIARQRTDNAQKD